MEGTEVASIRVYPGVNAWLGASRLFPAAGGHANFAVSLILPCSIFMSFGANLSPMSVSVAKFRSSDV
jgi:hypothetical protein